jgi:hypothetical protein
MAIGQLADYRRFVTNKPNCIILLPEMPPDDLIDLLAIEEIGLLVLMARSSPTSPLYDRLPCRSTMNWKRLMWPPEWPHAHSRGRA